MNLTPKITFGIINYNRLFYLKSCVKSLLESIDGYENIELICIDDESREEGTTEYLDQLESSGWKVFRKGSYKDKNLIGKNNVDHISYFAQSLNIIYENSSGELIVPLQGDCQFVRKDWIKSYVDLFSNNHQIGSALLDAQRKVRIESSLFDKISDNFYFDNKRETINGAGDSVYRRKMIDDVGGWKESLDSQLTSEDIFSKSASSLGYKVAVPKIPVTIAICTDPRGTNARVRGNKRYGKYWRGLNDQYYSWINIGEFDSKKNLIDKPFSIEELASSNGDWELPIDQFGNWKKNPINIETASKNDYEVIFEFNDHIKFEDGNFKDDNSYMNEWLED